MHANLYRLLLITGADVERKGKRKTVILKHVETSKGREGQPVHVSRIAALVLKIVNALVVETDMENETKGKIVQVMFLKKDREKTFISENKSLQRLICRNMELYFFKEIEQIWKVWFYSL